jgi:hypothetical protein
MSEDVEALRYQELHPFENERLTELRITQRQFLLLIPPDLHQHVRELEYGGTSRKSSRLDALIELRLRELAEETLAHAGVSALRKKFEIETLKRNVMPIMRDFLGAEPEIISGHSLEPAWRLQNIEIADRGNGVRELPEIVATLDLADFLADDGFKWTV